MEIGVLSLQGDYINHINVLKTCNVNTREVKYAADFDSIDALIIPGGESTTISNLIEKQNLYKVINEFISIKPVYGTCAGLILLASIITNNNESKKIKSFKILDMEIERNGWGRQVDSFTEKVEVKSFKEKFKALFIRAPKIKSLNKNIEVLSRVLDTPIMIKKNHILGTTFHPELTEDIRIHEYFINMVKEHKILC